MAFIRFLFVHLLPIALIVEVAFSGSSGDFWVRLLLAVEGFLYAAGLCFVLADEIGRTLLFGPQTSEH
eukprot:16445078-Heterocapsa_arctica.AAC.1